MKDFENPPANRFMGKDLENPYANVVERRNAQAEPHDDWFWVYPDDFWF
jgi:hypothetical protein